MDQVEARHAAGALLLDVREADEFASGHVPGAVNLPLGGVSAQAHRFAGQSVCVICRSGQWSLRAAAPLNQAGADAGRWNARCARCAWSLVLVPVAASLAFDPLKWVAAFVGAGLTSAAITDTCAMARALSLLPYNRTNSCDAPVPMSALTGSTPTDRS